MVDAKLKAEGHIVKVEESYRIRLPQSFIHKIDWIMGDQPISAWLLVAGPGRCRLQSSSEVDNQPEFKSLRERITAELRMHMTNPLEFQDKTSVALTLRLLAVEVTP